MNEIQLDVGDPEVAVYVETPETGLTPAAKDSDVVTSEVLKRAIKAIASGLRDELAALSDPDELSVEFGATLKGGASVLLSAEGTFKVTIKWLKSRSA